MAADQFVGSKDRKHSLFLNISQVYKDSGDNSLQLKLNLEQRACVLTFTKSSPNFQN